ncbi:MAG TPA: neocarzinostatin apoprotein domain-containing protein [Acidimicrobiales bacterium]|nr:neocarzinostatin apoprotein domain-containing protein [Acidimicrobiales bacterium]
MSPSTELADGQLVTVTGTGFTPNDSVGMAECKAVAGSTSESNCDLDTVDFAFTDASGDFTIGYNVTRILNVNGGNVDCAVSLCLLGAADESDYSVAASAALEFNPDIPPELSGTVSPTGGVNTKTGTAFLSGTVHCVAAAQVQVDVELSQIYHRRFNFTNEVYRFVNCKPRRKGTAWKVRVPPGDGLYGKGKATAVAQFSAPIGNSLRNYTATATVVLSPTTETK